MSEWVITGAVSILSLVLGHWLGVLRERHAQALRNRLDLLKPVEEWLDIANRLVHIVADDMVALGQGLPLPLGYSLEDRRTTGRHIAEATPKVMATLESKALSTCGTRTLASQLSTTIRDVNDHLQRDLLPVDAELVSKGSSHKDLSQALMAASLPWMDASAKIQRAYELIAKTKVRLT